jgi:hypothetical protein
MVDKIKTYEDGIVEGRLAAVEHMQTGQNLRLDNHSQRISSLERAMWVVIGAIAALEFFPVIAKMIKVVVGLE